ncbi:MAG: polysaccharide pyruvyl transferase family protein, partial [Clostridia bacterium]|nr:polysaccharide pyruvyl transferase family protein [Clostridia bacterium]
HLDDKKGTGCVLLNNDKAKKYFNIVKKGFKVVEEEDIEINKKCNGNVFGSSKEHKFRDRFFKLLKKYPLSRTLKRIEKSWFDVGFVGWWYGTNYGSGLSCFALHDAIESLGYDTLMLEWPEEKRPFKKLPDNNIRRIAKKYYNCSAQYTFEDYPKLNNHIGQFLLGSDQLWCWWCCKDNVDYYMMDFVHPERKKITYATSFGHPRYPAPKAVLEKQAKQMQDFDAISIREDDGVELCKNLFGAKATRTIDPVFLCDKSKFEELIKEAKIEFDKPYMLAYILSPNKEKGEVLKKTAEKLGLDLIIILDGQTDLEENKKLLGIENVRTNVGIEEWLAYIYNSSHVVTDSFHGTCFSIIFEKQFTCIMNRARGISRFNTLLGHLDLMNIGVEDPMLILDSGVLDSKIDYTKVNKILKEEVERSREWLKNALAMPKQPRFASAIEKPKTETVVQKQETKQNDVFSTKEKLYETIAQVSAKHDPFVYEGLELPNGFYQDKFGNQIYAPKGTKLSKVVFKGNNNKIYLGSGLVGLSNVTFTLGSNAVVRIDDGVKFSAAVKIEALGLTGSSLFKVGKNCRFTDALVRLYGSSNCSRIVIGDDCSFETNFDVHANSGKAIVMGNDCMISHNVSLWAGDGHSMFDVKTKKNTNSFFKNQTVKQNLLYIGNHVWVAEGAFVMHNTSIGDGCVVGARSVVKGTYKNNCTIAGNPAK